MLSTSEMNAAVRKFVGKLRGRTATGFDGIPASFLKYASVPETPGSAVRRNVVIPLLAKLFHMLFSHGLCPDAWKVARLSPLHKKGDPLDPNNYRMLAVNSVLYRVYANVTREVITDWCVKHSKVPSCQFGFYPGRNTQQPLFILRHLIHATKADRKGPLFAAFVDFKQAYDTLYAGDSYILVDGDTCTPPMAPAMGVKQGCPLSPLLFALYIHDVDAYFLTSDVIAGMGGTAGTGFVRLGSGTQAVRVSHVLYADD